MTNRPDSANKEAVARLWAQEADERVRYGKGFHWVESPIVMAYLNEQITGDANLDWLTYSYRKYVEGREPPVDRILSLGCGGGILERGLCEFGFSGRIDAWDISEGAIKLARARAKEVGFDNIHYDVCDLNQVVLLQESFDVVFSSGALHHVSALEHLLDQIRGSLREQGLLIINEYVGPAQLQWTPRQTQIIDELLRLLPEKHRRRVSAPDQLKDRFWGPSPIHEMNANDPSEAVRSNEIIPLIRSRFAVREQKEFGGTLLHMLLQDIVGNFNPSDPTDAAFLRLLIYVEKLVVRENILGSDFAFMVAEKDRTTELELEIAALRDQLRDLQAENQAMKSSVGWQLLQRYRKAKAALVPPGSRRERFYRRLVELLRKRLARES